MGQQWGREPQRAITPEKPDSAVSLNGVRKTYESLTGSVDAISQVSFEIADGEFVSLIGASGCGKSTVLKVIAGLINHQVGDVSVLGEPARAGRREVGLMFQAPVLLPWRTVRQNIVLPFEIFGEPVDETTQNRATELLNLVGLSGFGDKHPWELSGGMRQRAALARLLITQPSVFLMDEPLAALDELTRERLVFELAELCERLHATALYVTHNIAEALILSDRVLVMSHHPGTILADVPVTLPRPRTIEIVSSVEFMEIGQEIRRILSLADSEASAVGAPS
jgi:NitT/TauT family transport system ATP-binding protein